MQLSTGAIVGIVIGSTLGFLILIVSVPIIIIVLNKRFAAHSGGYRSHAMGGAAPACVGVGGCH